MQAPRQRRATESSSSEYTSSGSDRSSERDHYSAPNSPHVGDGAEPFFEDDDDIPRGESRGKKGLTHEEMAMVRYQTGAEDESTQSESEDDHKEAHHSTQELAKETTNIRRDNIVDPVVAKAADLLENKGLEMNVIGYAKLQGAGKGAIDYLVRLQSVTIGRVGFGTDCELKSEAKLVSRQHARLFWDQKIDRWCITCLSKNGLLVDGTPVAASAPPMPLKSRSLIEIGDVAFFFLLATGSLFRVDDIALLEKKIVQARSMHDDYSDDDGYSDEYLVDQYGPYRVSNGVKVRVKRHSRAATGSERAASKNARGTGGVHGSGKKGKGKSSEKKGKPVEESDYTTTESESEEEDIPDILDDAKYKPMLIPLPSMNGKRKHGSERTDGRKRRKKSRSSHAESSGDEYHTAGQGGWIKKEKGDFARALFAVGVDPIYDDGGKLTHFSWERFRRIAELANKTDYQLEEHYRHFMNDVHTLLDDEEREKREKGPRTKHKKGCECAVCLNAAKSRERKRALNEDNGDTEDDREPKSTGRPHDKLVGLVTAQKLRVRMGIHEAALQVARDTMQANTVFQKINANRQTTELKDFPLWWTVGYHDKTLMQGVHKHGVGNWDNIWHDDTLSRFARVKEKDNRGEASWPSNQAVMKRVRDLSSMIVSEMKRCAKKEREMRKFAKKKEKRLMKRREREQQRTGRKHEYRPPPPQREADVSTAEESESEEERPAAEIETEDEDAVEVEVEEMEVLDEGEEGQSFDDDQDGEQDTTPTRKGVVGAADDTTDEEEDDDVDGHIEAEVEYETASETGSEG